MVFAAGACVSLLLFVLTSSQGGRQQSAEGAASDLRTSESKFRRLVESNLVGVAFTNLDGVIIDGNDEYLRILGRRRDEVTGGKVRLEDLPPPEFAELD